MKKGNSVIHILAVVSMFFWGMSYIWTKIVFEYYSPLTTVFLRLLLSTIILFLIISLFFKFQKIKKKHYWLFLVSALLNPFLYFIGESFGLKLVSATLSAVIIATIPLFTPIAAFIAFNKKISMLNIFGVIFSFFGVMIMIFNADLSLRASPVGLLYLFGAVTAAIFYTVLLRILTDHYSPIIIITYQNFIGVFYFLPLFLVFEWNEFISIKPNFILIFTLLKLALFASSLAFVLYTMVLRKLGISRAAVYSNLIPVFAALASYIILDELFDLNKILGIIIVITGVLLTQLRKVRKFRRKKG